MYYNNSIRTFSAMYYVFLFYDACRAQFTLKHFKLVGNQATDTKYSRWRANS